MGSLDDPGERMVDLILSWVVAATLICYHRDMMPLPYFIAMVRVPNQIIHSSLPSPSLSLSRSRGGLSRDTLRVVGFLSGRWYFGVKGLRSAGDSLPPICVSYISVRELTCMYKRNGMKSYDTNG